VILLRDEPLDQAELEPFRSLKSERTLLDFHARHAAIDSFDEVRSSVHACVETYAPALRSDELRERMAAGYATVRESAVQLATKAMQDGGMPAPENLAAIASVLMAVCDGLMLQWIADPDGPPKAAETLDALAAIGSLTSMR